MKTKKSILFTIILFVSCTLNAQFEIKAEEGSFEDLVPWGDGYLGVVQTQLYAVMPKYRQFQYFDADGNLKWNEKVTPYNFNNATVCHNESEFAYFINMPFSKTALAEKTSKTELLNIYQVQKSGKVTAKEITYTGVLKPLAGYVKNMEQCYLGAFKDGIIFVGTNDNLKYHVVKIDHEFNVSYKTFDFEWDEKLWEKNKISDVKYVLGENELSLIQLKHNGNKLITTIKTIDLSTFSDVVIVTNNIDFSGYTLNSKSGYDIEYSIEERLFKSYFRTVWQGQNAYYVPTLGAFTNFVYTKNGLKMYAYYRNIKAETRNEVEKEGFLLFNMNNEEDEDVSPLSEFEFKSEKNGSSSHAFHVTQTGKFVFISQQSKSNIILRSSDGEEKTFIADLSFAEVYLSYITGQTREKSDAIDVLSIVGEKFTGIDFDGIKNSFGNTKKAVIYNY